MSKTAARLLIAAVVLLTAANWFYTRRATAAAKAARQSSFTQATCRSYVPQQWGEYKGSSSGFDVAFEDSSGTLRFVTNVACAHRAHDSAGHAQVARAITSSSPLRLS
jgi:hypothetical protein